MGSPDCICDGTDFGDYAAEEEDVEKSLEESEEEQTEAGRIEVGEIRIGR